MSYFYNVYAGSSADGHFLYKAGSATTFAWSLELDETLGVLQWAIRTTVGATTVSGVTKIDPIQTVNDGDHKLHVAVATWDSATEQMVLYLDGEVENTGTRSGTTLDADTNPIRMFVHASSASRRLNGDILLNAMWRRALTADEAVELTKNPYAMFGNPNEFLTRVPLYTMIGGVAVALDRRQIWTTAG